MRLGLNWGPRGDRDDLGERLGAIDELEVGSVAPPPDMLEWSLDRCRDYGSVVRDFGLTVGEVGLDVNLLHPDPETRAAGIETVRAALRRAEAMGAACVFTLAGSRSGDGVLAFHPDNFSANTRDRVRSNCRSILDGLSLDSTGYALEPWHGGFFHEPDAVERFLDTVDRVQLHMDAPNMHTPKDFGESERVIETAFDRLADDVVSVHIKDLLWAPDRVFLHIDEVKPGDGVLAMETYLDRISALPPDVPVFVEHWETAEAHRRALRRVRDMRSARGIQRVSRNSS